MVYIRSKIVKGESYSYLVRSKWNSKRKTSRQETVKYLGRTENISLNDIPTEYQTEPLVISYLANNQELNLIERGKYLEKTRKILLRFLLDGNLEKSLSVSRNFISLFKTAIFFDEILRPIMYEIGNLWKNNKLDVGSEHIASNTAVHLIKSLLPRIKPKSRGKTILICTPNGEHHLLPCLMIESFLAQNGYKIINIAPSAPTKSITRYISENNPDLILISITLTDNINSARRLIKSLEILKIPILIGGQALHNKNKIGTAKTLSNISMNQLLRVVKEEIT